MKSTRKHGGGRPRTERGTTRAERDRAHVLALQRKRSKAYRKRLKEKATEATKGKRSGYTWRVRPQELPEPPAAVALPEPEPAPMLPWSGAAPPAPEPEEPDWARRVAKDKVRQEAAVKSALERDARLVEKMLAQMPEGPPQGSVFDPADFEDAPTCKCRICGEGEGSFRNNYLCGACVDSMTFHITCDDRWASWEPTIKARISKLARYAATKLTVACGVEGCPNRVPDPEGLQRTDETCDECMRILVGDRAVLKGMLRNEF